MSEYSFELGNPEVNEIIGATEQEPAQREPKWFRERMDKVSDEIKALKAENDRLKAERARREVEQALTAKGYAPSAAVLFEGEPAQLDEWLGKHGSALARAEGSGGESAQEDPAGPPATTVPADGQEQIQRMQEAGTQGVAAPQGSDKELAAALQAAQSQEEFAKIMQAHGSPYDFSS